MKTIYTILLLLIIIYADSISGQSIPPQQIDLTNLSIPNSPAFMLLDVAPTQIERPTSGKAFALSILNAVNENNGIPQNYAVEFTPYWYFKHPNLSAFKYWGIDPETKQNKGFEQIKQSNISFAYVSSKRADTLSPQNTSNIAMGIRGTIFQLISKKNRNDLVAANAKIIERMSELNSEISKFDQFDEGFKEKVQEFIDNADADEKLLEQEESLKEILNRKPLFAIDGAAAVNWAFNGNNFSTNQLSLFGAWLTFNYSQELNPNSGEQKNYISLLMLTRYTYDNSVDGNPLSQGAFVNLFDLGGKVDFEFKQLSVSFEYIFRTVSGQTYNTFRANGLAMYKVSDTVYLLASLGKNFGETNNLIAQFGINLGFGSGNEKVFTFNQ